MHISSPGRGRLIMFDGPDGAGKTTQIDMAATALRSLGHQVHTTRAHGGTPIGERLREISLDSSIERAPITDLLLSQTIHAELSHDLQPRLQQGTWCLVDRSPLSMWSYQVRASGVDEKIARPIVEADLGMLHPDLLIVYTASLDVLKQRRASRTAITDYFETKQDSFHQATIDGYDEAAKLFGAQIIDASLPISEVHVRTMDLIQDHLGNHDRIISIS